MADTAPERTDTELPHGITKEQAFELASDAERPILEILMKPGVVFTNRARLLAAREIAARASVSPTAPVVEEDQDLGKPETDPSLPEVVFPKDKVESGWQPISTAPRDATPILVGLIADGRVWRASDAKFYGVGFYTAHGGQSCHWATHWTALPPVTTQPGDDSKAEHDERLRPASAPESAGSVSATSAVCVKCGHNNVSDSEKGTSIYGMCVEAVSDSSYTGWPKPKMACGCACEFSTTSAKADAVDWEVDAREIVDRLRTVPDVDISDCCERHAIDEIIEVLARRAATGGRNETRLVVLMSTALERIAEVATAGEKAAQGDAAERFQWIKERAEKARDLPEKEDK